MARPRFRTLTVAACIIAIPFYFSACGLGDDMDVGNERGSQKPGTGGSDGSGGSSTTGGTGTSGGAGPATGGAKASGGAVASGGATAAGGNSASGGLTATGGASANGGTASGGTSTTGGARATGGIRITSGDGGLTGGKPGSGGGDTCGNTVCGDGEYCCNPSCSVCAPKNGGCTLQVCEPKTCTTANDCRLVDDYCTGCNCRALGPGETLPACTGPGVQCLIAPCDGEAPTCKDGRCILK